MKITLFILMTCLLTACASSSKKETISYIEKPKTDCIQIGDLTAVGFSLIPPVASAVARSMLEEKALENRVNTIRIDKESGLFQVELKATGYRCAEPGEITKNKKNKKS